MASNVSHNSRWVVTWMAGSRKPNDNHPGTPAGEPLAIFPGRTRRAIIEGAMEALFQMIAGSNADAQISQSSDKPPYEVEWDSSGLNAKLGHDPMIWAHHSRVRFDHSTKTLDATEGKGAVTFQPTKPWQSRDEHFADLRAERRANGLQC